MNIFAAFCPSYSFVLFIARDDESLVAAVVKA
jgi:hypothetical protein